MDPPQEGDEDTGFSGRVAQGARGASNKAAEKKEKDEALKNAGEKASKIVRTPLLSGVGCMQLCA